MRYKLVRPSSEESPLVKYMKFDKSLYHMTALVRAKPMGESAETVGVPDS